MLAFVQRVGELAETEGHHPRHQLRLGIRLGFGGRSCSASHLAAASWRMWRRSALTVVIVR
jgi:hypothetical protein